MPIWAYVYCGIIVASCLFNIRDKRRLKKVYQPAGEILYCVLGVLVFLIAYSVVVVSQPVAISTTCFLYTLAWSYHAHRHYLDYETFSSEIHDTAKDDIERTNSEVEELVKDAKEDREDSIDIDDLFEEYSYSIVERQARMFYWVAVGALGLIFLPYLYVYLKILGFFS